MKRYSNLFNLICSTENMHLAFYKASKNKRLSNAYLLFRKNYEKNLETVQHELIHGMRHFSYTQFKIFDPKERIITVAPFPDRIIHHAIMNILEPIFEQQMIYHTYACRKGKGTHAAARYAYRCAKRYSHFLKLDVRKYFDSVSHEVLKQQLSRIIKDERTLALLFTIIDGYTSPLSTSRIKRGLPIGNLTSQFFANLYLSSLDHLVLEKLKPKAYIRYMDDFVMFDNSLLRLKHIFSCIKTYLHHVLNLSLKPETFGKTAHGVAFLGWLISSDRVKVTTKTHRRMKRTLNAINTKWQCGLMSDDEAIMRTLCVTSVRKLHM